MKLNFKTLSNYMVGVYVLAVIVFFIVPIPSLLLDILVAFIAATTKNVEHRVYHSVEHTNTESTDKCTKQIDNKV